MVFLQLTGSYMYIRFKYIYIYQWFLLSILFIYNDIQRFIIYFFYRGGNMGGNRASGMGMGGGGGMGGNMGGGMGGMGMGMGGGGGMGGSNMGGGGGMGGGGKSIVIV